MAVASRYGIRAFRSRPPLCHAPFPPPVRPPEDRPARTPLKKATLAVSSASSAALKALPRVEAKATRPCRSSSSTLTSAPEARKALSTRSRSSGDPGSAAATTGPCLSFREAEIVAAGIGLLQMLKTVA